MKSRPCQLDLTSTLNVHWHVPFLAVTAFKRMIIFVGIIILNQKANAMLMLYTANTTITTGDDKRSRHDEMKELLVDKHPPVPTMTLKFDFAQLSMT
jgi:hypothetical protein